MEIPFLDLKSMYNELAVALESKVLEVLRSTQYVGGDEIREFEQEFAEYCEAEYCVSVSSGTDALRLIFMSMGLQPDQYVVTVPNTFIASTEAISQAGLKIKFVDVDPHTANMDPHELEACLRRAKFKGESIGAVLPVHLYGQPADLQRIMRIADSFGVPVIEDACQAHGAYTNIGQGRKRIGGIGIASAFSFYPGKNLGGFGDGGAIVTNDIGIRNNAVILREHGQSKKYFHEIEGFTARLDAVQAAYLRVKLRALEDWNEKRREVAGLYDSLLSQIDGVKIVRPYKNSIPVYHLYVIQVQNRDELQRYLADRGVGTGLHYPYPLHLLPAYRHLGHHEGDFEIAESLASKVLSLPMFPGMSPAEVEYVVDCVRAFVEQKTVPTYN